MSQRRPITRRRDPGVTQQRPPTAHRLGWLVCAAILVVLAVGTATVVYSLFPSQSLVDTSPTSPGPVEGRQHASGDESRVVEHQELNRSPDDPNAYYNLGLALQSQGKLTEAVREYRRALEFDDDHAEAHNNLAVALAASDELNEAIDHFRRVVELKPDYAQGHLNLGNALIAQCKLDEAIHHYRRAVELKADYAKAHNNLAVALKQTGRLEEAYRHMQEAMRLKRAEEKP